MTVRKCNAAAAAAEAQPKLKLPLASRYRRLGFGLIDRNPKCRRQRLRRPPAATVGSHVSGSVVRVRRRPGSL